MVHEVDLIKSVNVRTVDGLIKNLFRYGGGHGHIWRGHSDRKWKLRTSLERRIAEDVESRIGGNFYSLDPVSRHEIITKKCNSLFQSLEWQSPRFGVLHNLVRNTQQYVPKSQYDKSKFSENMTDAFERTWALIQHNGGLSPVLDWTHSPFVAAFFACADAIRDPKNLKRGHCCIWGLNCHTVKELQVQRNNAFSFQMILPGPENARMIAQQGVLSYLVPIMPYDELFSRITLNEQIFNDHALIKLEFPRSFAWEILKIVNKMNINSATLFPDIHGVVAHASMSSQSNSYEGTTGTHSLGAGLLGMPELKSIPSGKL